MFSDSSPGPTQRHKAWAVSCWKGPYVHSSGTQSLTLVFSHVHVDLDGFWALSNVHERPLRPSPLSPTLAQLVRRSDVPIRCCKIHLTDLKFDWNKVVEKWLHKCISSMCNIFLFSRVRRCKIENLSYVSPPPFSSSYCFLSTFFNIFHPIFHANGT